MNVWYIIDGYNLFFHVEEDPSCTNRKAFVEEISSLMRAKNFHGEMIFDTPMHHYSPLPHTTEDPPLTIAFAADGQEADDMIIEKLHGINRPEKVVVVSADRELCKRARDEGAKTLSSVAFLQKLHQKKRGKRPSKKNIPESDKERDRLREIFEKKFYEP